MSDPNSNREPSGSIPGAENYSGEQKDKYTKAYKQVREIFEKAGIPFNEPVSGSSIALRYAESQLKSNEEGTPIRTVPLEIQGRDNTFIVKDLSDPIDGVSFNYGSGKYEKAFHAWSWINLNELHKLTAEDYLSISDPVSKQFDNTTNLLEGKIMSGLIINLPSYSFKLGFNKDGLSFGTLEPYLADNYNGHPYSESKKEISPSSKREFACLIVDYADTLSLVINNLYKTKGIDAIIHFTTQYEKDRATLKDDLAFPDGIFSLKPGKQSSKQEIKSEKPEETTESNAPEEIDFNHASMIDRYSLVQGEVDPENPYFIEQPDERFLQEPIDRISAQTLSSLESQRPFFVNIHDAGNGRATWSVNREVAPYVFIDTGEERFLSAEALTNNDSGFFALWAIAGKSPREQAMIFKKATEIVLAVHINNPNLISEWLKAQKRDPRATYGSQDIFLAFDRDKPDNEQLLMFALTNKEFSTTTFLSTWGRRITKLEDALRDDKLDLNHLRWIEFLSHSIDGKMLHDLIKNVVLQNQQPPPQDLL